MNDTTLKDILKKYEQKRSLSEKKLDIKINNLYSNNKRLQDIDFELQKLYYKKSKNIILNVNDDSVEKNINSLQNERDKILKSLNIGKDFFLAEHDCNLCNDTGYIKNSDGTSSMCSCLKQELINVNFNKANISNLEIENFDNFNLNLFSDEVNFEKYNSKISPKENMKNIKNLALNFIKNFDDPNEKNLLYTGNTGLR